ncbi:hypothetical protein DIJ64_00295 [Mycobacterium leprae]|uniref:Uncharacterized protein n=1 Tax=Mycobacterium leprae TaxID=1769 RepID=A0AAD0KPB0_MYCLR|nr:hypothetical protein [Mycobacterium leprae]AWV47068.1 hypothetical protein DIJ64_00295 [Mycobacterium leprae]OAR21330.1 hypothetical protein A8144_06935 [Mycobacterium leprae 3125609]OAX71415.1 hypothetical protein A3216_06110 [Mycobacterium leprae 7935681]
MSLSKMGALGTRAGWPGHHIIATYLRGPHAGEGGGKNCGWQKLTNARLKSTAKCSTALLRSPRNRDGCSEKSSAALVIDSVISLVTSSRTGWVTMFGQVFA